MWKLLTTTKCDSGFTKGSERKNAMLHLVIHPGEHLAEELRELNMSAAALARQLQVPTNRITQILNGNRDITADTALRLAHFFGTTAEFWINLQSIYDLRIAQQESGKTIQELPTLKQMTAAHA
jgi:addiction module HigA family antidote